MNRPIIIGLNNIYSNIKQKLIINTNNATKNFDYTAVADRQLE